MVGLKLQFAACFMALQAYASSLDIAALDTFYSSPRNCPATCSSTAENWAVFSSVDHVKVCEEPQLVDFAIHTPLDDQDAFIRVRSCTAGGNPADKGNGLNTDENDHDKRDTTCISGKEATVSFGLAMNSTEGTADASHLRSSTALLQKYLADTTHCSTKFLISYHKDAIVAVYSGAAVENGRTASAALSAIEEKLQGKAPSAAVMQLCGKDRSADFNFGVAIDTTGNFVAVQRAVAAWANGECYSGDGLVDAGKISNVKVFETPLVPVTHSSNSTAASKKLMARGDCTTQKVASGDTCGTLASKCGISPADFTKYNPGDKMCSTLQPGQRVCCSAGTLPDITPKPNSDGSCAVYSVQPDDYCALIAANNGLTVNQLDRFNNGTTWGWNGCGKLAAGIKMCLSKGDPPMPAWVPNAVCGPIKPGSRRPSDGSSIQMMNQCPLNACCDIWGQCGITPDYCTMETGPSKNPGTAPPNKNGCISNCGVTVINDAVPPADFIKVGYYESWNWDRPCLNYRAHSLGGSTFTHAHWGFATLTDDFHATINDTYKQLDKFLALPQHKVLSFGGWGYSTEPATFDKLRKAMSPENAENFAVNLVSYAGSKGFNGIDIDWEYPGAPDIPGIPPGLESDAPNYLAFLKYLRKYADTEKLTISIAAPASYWYLKAFPIKQMAEVVDYIVYMTYDLHGQWDYNNKWSQDGCITGNCIRSHINITETTYALAMITKAGVAANKLVVGVSSYGRSFGLHNRAACEHSLTSPGCTFLGPESAATAGNCTNTPGYISNAEINDILDSQVANAKFVRDEASDSDILYYGDNFVAYMSDTTKNSRIGFYKKGNFGGSVDWAVDLAEFTDDDGADPKDDDDDDGLDDEDEVDGDLPPCDASYSTMDDLDAHAADIPEHCVALYTLRALKGLLAEAMKNYTELVDHEGYDGKFKTYSNAVADQAGGSLKDYLDKHSNDYATCQVAELTMCCSACHKPSGSHNDNYCGWCFQADKCYHSCGVLGCNDKRDLTLDAPDGYMENLDSTPETGLALLAARGDGGPPTQQPIIKFVKEDEPCPPDYSKRGYGPDNPYEQSVYFTWKNMSGFYADLALDTGIPKDKTKMGDYTFIDSCSPADKKDPDADCHYIGVYYNVPLIDGFSASDVANPKDIVSKSLDKIRDLPASIDQALALLDIEGYPGDPSDLMDSLSLPIFMIASATEAMETVKEVADKIDEAKRKAIILAFLSALFLFIPIIGEIAGSIAEIADITAVTALIGAAGNAAVDIYTIVDDPDNAPLAIFDLILTPLALTDVAAIAKAAEARRGMKAEDVAKLGDKVKVKTDIIDKVKGVCRKGMEE